MNQNHELNFLKDETSPYLLQHVNNPVKWYPWQIGLQIAKKENKLLFISIGYAACHWCHVMEEESFTDSDTAALMNELYINIKIDREERPDLDSYYQKAVSMLSGKPGGWPLSVFATPDGKAFAGGTYFPKKQSYNLPSFKQVLSYIYVEYQKNPLKILEVSQDVITRLETRFRKKMPNDSISISTVIDNMLGSLLDSIDSIFGGFGVQPKFPQVNDLRFLLLAYSRRKNQEILDFIISTLDNMAAGGIYDQLGSGFHRYSVDRKWLVPHFEKMLYDNAQMVLIYLELYQVTKKEHYADIARDVIEYLKREMMSQMGGFYSSQDADSEGEEGKFFLWTIDEIKDVLGNEAGDKFSQYYGLTKEGNFEKGYSVLRKTSNLSDENFKELKEKLFFYREKREKPFLNDNIILSWNSLAIYALARASFILDSPEYLELAEKSLNFILNNMVEKTTNRLYRHFRIRPKTLAFSEDYTLFIRALLEVFSFSGKKFYLNHAIDLQHILDENFWDNKNKGYYFSGKWQKDLAYNEKPVVTFSLPSPNSIGLENLLRLYHYLGDNKYLERADKLTNFLLGWYDTHGYLSGDSLIALDLYQEKPVEVVFITNRELNKQKSLFKLFQKKYLPNSIIMKVTENSMEEFSNLHIIKSKISSKDPVDLFQGSVFICKNLTCSLPLRSSDEINQYLQELDH